MMCQLSKYNNIYLDCFVSSPLAARHNNVTETCQVVICASFPVPPILLQPTLIPANCYIIHAAAECNPS